ncbi:hypothetical protein GOY07_01950 [Wolbachia endosymbiont of Litomosoides sigmodontis]|uniref:hypothetical protein n=1 Tax=Wolbachia endosymbiont of Litomosoides sigmodontis TaxID=80850 RepID=UPI00158B9F3A|nr:hypothetical protein [Wolbachia endosymbiont of Litomosoides sigmodontis]QKX02963.1 hypothetical protein GOY07_01950 [Wolbachia endosymbiont of Litomosoides sigmodontis]
MKGSLKETWHCDDPSQILQLKTRMAVDRAIIIGSVCSVIAALAVSSECSLCLRCSIINVSYS